MTELLPAQKLNERGQCCGRKPLLYKTKVDQHAKAPHKYCTRCNAAYDVDTGKQIDNWAYREVGTDGQFVNRQIGGRS